MADETSTSSTPTGSSDMDKRFDVVLGKATDRFEPWQQIPAWVLGGAAILGGAVLIVFPHHLDSGQSRSAWAAIIVALFLAVLLSYRSALTLNADDGPRAGSGQAGDGGSAPSPQQPAAASRASAETPTTPQPTPRTGPGGTVPPTRRRA